MGCGESKRKCEVPVLKPLDTLVDHRSAIDDYLQKMQVLDKGQVAARKASAKSEFDDIIKKQVATGVVCNDRLKKEFDQKMKKQEKTEAEKAKEKEEFGKNVKEAQKANTLALWNEFDKNGDGFLEPEENRALVKAYLSATQKNFPAILKFHLNVETSKSCAMLREYVKAKMKLEDGGNLIDYGWAKVVMNMFSWKLENKITSEMNAQISTIEEKAGAQLGQMLKDSDKIADDFLKAADLNHDGNVDRMEFEQKFADLVLQVFDMNAIWEATTTKIEAEAKVQTEAMLRECREKAAAEPAATEKKAAEEKAATKKK